MSEIAVSFKHYFVFINSIESFVAATNCTFEKDMCNWRPVPVSGEYFWERATVFDHLVGLFGGPVGDHTTQQTSGMALFS